MRKIINLLFVLAIITTVFSCGKDDDDVVAPVTPVTPGGSSSENPFVGTWVMSELAYTVDATTSAGGQSISSQTVANGENLDYTIEFMEDTFTGSGGYDIVLVTTLQGTEIEQISEIRDVQGAGEYVFDDTTITFTSGSLVTFENNGANSSGMASAEPTPYTIDANGDLIITTSTTTTSTTQGALVTQEVDSTIKFVKQ